MASIKRLFSLLLVWWGRGPQPSPAPTIAGLDHLDGETVTVLPDEPPLSLAKVVAPSSPVEYGEFYFRDTILDQLDRYFTILRRIKKADPDAYDLHAQIGAQILPERKEAEYLTHDSSALAPWFNTHRPSFGMVMYGTRTKEVRIDAGKKYWVPFAVYFKKYDWKGVPEEVQRLRDGDIYVVTIYWDSFTEERRGKGGAPQQFPILLKSDGTLQLLKTLLDGSVQVRAKKGRDRGRSFTVPSRKWGFHKSFVQWADEHKMPVQGFLERRFLEVANAFSLSSTGFVRVKASRADVTAAFSVNVLRMPYFFNDREVTAGNTGRRKRIFHIVRTHARQVRGGQSVPVRTHFRGERAFSWNGYSIKITVPGWHHWNTSTLGIGAYDDPAELGDDIIYAKEIGRLLMREEDAGRGAHRAA